MITHIQTYKSNNNKEMIIQSIKWALKLIDLQKEVSNKKTIFYLTELAEYYFNLGEFQQAEQYASEAIS